MSITVKPNYNFEKLHSKILGKIKNNSLLEEGERVVKTWRFDKQPIHAGQIRGEKILPNGNKQVRITTVYAGSPKIITTDTRVYNPSGDLLRSYHGMRGLEATVTDNADNIIKKDLATRAYGNTSSEIAEIIRRENSMNPGIKYLPY